MKKILFCILATLPLAYCMTGCSNDTDYGGFSYFIWANDSDHRITLSVAREYGELVIENEIIEPGESFESERVDGAIAYCPPPSRDRKSTRLNSSHPSSSRMPSSA